MVTTANEERMLELERERDFTGYADCDGHKIYRGDVLTDANGKEYPYFDEGKVNYVAVVEWIFGGWQVVLRCVNPEKRGISDGINSELDQGEGAEGFRVIGNLRDEAWSALRDNEDGGDD